MKYTRLGSSGLKVSRIALGCMSFGDTSRMPWALDDDGAEPIFRQAVESGITFWDTANIYGHGSSEEIVGRAIDRYTRREDVVLATKLFSKMHDGPGGSGLSRKAIMEQIDASLTRLSTDYVDLYQIHRFDPETPVEETMEALHDIVKAGKVRYIGASSMWAWQFAKLQHTARTHGWTPFVSMQDQYSLLAREEEREMFGLLADLGVGSIPWSPSGRRPGRPPLGPGQLRTGQDQPRRRHVRPPVVPGHRPGDRRRRPGHRRSTRRVDGHRRVGVGAAQPRRVRPDRRFHQGPPPHRRCRRPGRAAHRRRGRRPGKPVHPPAAYLFLKTSDQAATDDTPRISRRR